MFREIDFPSFWNAKYFPALDGMRALCVVMVIFNHIHVAGPKWILGWAGVDVFFVLSGFLITTLLIREREGAGSVSLKGFYTRRFFRIVPVYLLVVLLYVPALIVSRDALRMSQFKIALPWLLTFMQEFRPSTSGNVFGHAWTLGIEEKFYLLWPLLLISLFPFRRRAMLLLSVVALAVMALPHTFSRSYGGLLIGAVLGIALSASSGWLSERRLPKIPDWVLGIVLAGSYTLMVYSERFVLLFSLAVSLIVGSLVLRSGWMRTVLSNRALVFIGKRSYSMYLMHVLAINAVEKVAPKLFSPSWASVVALSFAVSLAGACALYVCVERPCMAYGKKLSNSISRFRTDLSAEFLVPVSAGTARRPAPVNVD